MNNEKFKKIIKESLGDKLDSFVRSKCDMSTDGSDVCELTRKEIVNILIQISDIKFSPDDVDYMVNLLRDLKRNPDQEIVKYEDIIKRIMNFKGNIVPNEDSMEELKESFKKYKLF
tara:strand:+ start:176 stop:523 length:348 start_codon:yes stop_codon:yes gene_type:complete